MVKYCFVVLIQRKLTGTERAPLPMGTYKLSPSEKIVHLDHTYTVHAFDEHVRRPADKGCGSDGPGGGS